MLTLSYPLLLPSQNPYNTILNSFVITVPPTIDLQSALPSVSLTRCGNCQIIQTSRTVLVGMKMNCVMCGFPTNLPEEHPVFTNNNKEILVFNNKTQAVEQEIPSTVYLFALVDTSGSMIYTYPKKENGKTVYVSRFEVAMAALKFGLKKLQQKDKTNRFKYKFCLITFGLEVTIFGDVTKKEPLRSLESRKMTFEEIIQWVKGKINFSGLIGKDLQESLNKLETTPIFNEKFQELIGGETNLGGALGTALGIIEDLKLPLSHILVFTDNYSNEGFLQLKYTEEFRKSPDHQDLYEDCRKMLLLEVKKVRDRVLKLRSSVDFVGFEDGIGVEFLSKMTGSFSKIYKAKVIEPVGSNEGDKIIDFNDFNLFVEKSLGKFEEILGFQSETSVFLNSIVKWIERNPKGLRDSEVTPGRDLEVIKDTLGNVWGGDQLSFSYKCVEKDARELQLIIHSEMELFYLNKSQNGKLELVPVVLVSEKILKGCDDFELEGQKIDFNSLRMAFEAQRLAYDKYETENMLILMHEFATKEMLESFWEELKEAGVAMFLEEKKNRNVYETEARERRSLRERIKITKEETKKNNNDILKKIGFMNVLKVKPMTTNQFKMRPKIEADETENTITVGGKNKLQNVELEKKIDFSEDN